MTSGLFPGGKQSRFNSSQDMTLERVKTVNDAIGSNLDITVKIVHGTR